MQLSHSIQFLIALQFLVPHCITQGTFLFLVLWERFKGIWLIELGFQFSYNFQFHLPQLKDIFLSQVLWVQFQKGFGLFNFFYKYLTVFCFFFNHQGEHSYFFGFYGLDFNVICLIQLYFRLSYSFQIHLPLHEAHPYFRFYGPDFNEVCLIQCGFYFFTVFSSTFNCQVFYFYLRFQVLNF